MDINGYKRNIKSTSLRIHSRGIVWELSMSGDDLILYKDKRAYKTIYTFSEGETLSGDGHIIQDEGVDLPNRSRLNFTGAGVNVYDSISATVVEILGGTASTVTTQDIDANVTVGGVTSGTNFPAGTELEVIIASILEAYIRPILSGLSVLLTPTQSTYEVGQTVTVGDASWSITNDSDSNPPQNMFLTGDGFNTTVTGTSQTVIPATTVTPTVQSTESWVLSGEDGNAAAIPSSNFSRNWYFSFLFGASTTVLTPVSTDPEAQVVLDALQQSVLRSSNNATITCGSYNNTVGNYTYIAYAAVHGDLTSILQNSSFQVLGAFTLLGDFNYTNAQGHIESYRIYISNADGAFADGTILTIT